MTICYRRTADLAAHTQGADVIGVAARQTGPLTGKHVGAKTFVIDVGTNVDTTATSSGMCTSPLLTDVGGVDAGARRSGAGDDGVVVAAHDHVGAALIEFERLGIEDNSANPCLGLRPARSALVTIWSATNKQIPYVRPL